SNDFVVRQKVLTELTYFQPRDSKLYPPFLKALLKDPAPEIRRQAIEKLWEHNIFLSDQELPATFEVHFIGTFDRTKPGQVAKLRKAAESAEAPGGWAIHNLGIIGDKEAIPLARDLLISKNVFTRFSAAMALWQLGEKKTAVDALHKITDATDDG